MRLDQIHHWRHHTAGARRMASSRATTSSKSPVICSASGRRTSTRHALADVKVELPVWPRTFYCAGMNYVKHLTEAANARGEVPDVPKRAEIGYRAHNALIAHDEDVVIPRTATEKIHYEGELAVVIGKKVKHLSEADAMSCVFGYTIGNDVSERAWQRADQGLWRSKNADTFKPMGPWIETEADVEKMQTTVRVNGNQKVSFRTNDMLFKIPQFIAEMTKYFTLWPGDVIWMGTDGQSPDIKAGDVVEIEISGVGTLRNRFVKGTIAPLTSLLGHGACLVGNDNRANGSLMTAMRIRATLSFPSRLSSSSRCRVPESSNLRNLPSVDQVMQTRAGFVAAEKFGRQATVDAIRAVLSLAREAKTEAGTADTFGTQAFARLEAQAQPHLRPVFNLTGTVLHTNLGRALIAERAIEAACVAMRQAVTLEFDVDSGSRGERDDHVRELLCEFTGAEDATVVNNNAAAVLLVLNTLAKGREAIVSRGELIEIGGAFRMPDIMARAGAKLVEIGTTNRTHKKDYAGALGPKTGLDPQGSHFELPDRRVHQGKYPRATSLKLARKHKVPLVNDLGSGTLVDLARFGLAHEPTVAESIAEGADLVTFSGDKLLGGPQAGFIVGK